MPRITVSLLATLAGGCLAGTSVQTAYPIGKGNLQAGIEPGIGGSTVAGEGLTLPAFNLALRYGLSDRTDIGGRIGTSGYELSGKYTFTSPEPGQLQVAVAPSVSVLYFALEGTGAGLVNAKLPVLVGIPLGGHELVLGPRAHAVDFFAQSGGEGGNWGVLNLGGQLGFALRLGPAARLLPEVGLEYPVVAGQPLSTDGLDLVMVGPDRRSYAFTLGLLLGGQ